MKTELEKLGNSRVRLNIEVDADTLEEALADAYRTVVREVSLPGFRKGKVPRAILESRFGPEVLYEDAMETLIPKAYDQAVKETNISPVDQPSVDLDKIEPGVGATIRLEVDVFPKADISRYTGIAVEKEIETVTEEDVEVTIAALRERQGELITVDSRDHVERGDFVVIDFKGYLDDAPFPGGAGEDHTLEIGSGQFIPGFEDQLVGAKRGEQVNIQVTFPEDYKSDLAGKEATFQVTVKDVKEKIVPEVDDEFAKDVSEDCETVEELKTLIRKDLNRAATARTKRRLENKLIEKIIEESEFDLPESMIKENTELVQQQMEQNWTYQGISKELFLETTGRSEEDLLADMRTEAITRLKRDLVLIRVAEEEGISVEEEEVGKQIDEHVEESSQPEQARRYWEGQTETLRGRLLVKKTIEWLVDHAEVTEVPFEDKNDES